MRSPVNEGRTLDIKAQHSELPGDGRDLQPFASQMLTGEVRKCRPPVNYQLIRFATYGKTQSNAASQLAFTRNTIQPAQFFFKNIEGLEDRVTDSPGRSLTANQWLSSSGNTESGLNSSRWTHPTMINDHHAAPRSQARKRDAQRSGFREFRRAC
jgi:hypothetical protein